MATAKTPEDAAKHLVQIFVHRFNSKPGAALRLNKFAAEFVRAPWEPADYGRGVEYASKRGWVQILDEDTLVLTEAGFAAA